MFESRHGECRSYFMTEEERQAIIKRYGAPVAPLTGRKFVGIHSPSPKLERKFTLSKKEYVAMKCQGMTDDEICERYKTTSTTLRKCKQKWNIPSGHKVNWDEKG